MSLYIYVCVCVCRCVYMLECMRILSRTREITNPIFALRLSFYEAHTSSNAPPLPLGGTTPPPFPLSVAKSELARLRSFPILFESL